MALFGRKEKKAVAKKETSPVKDTEKAEISVVAGEPRSASLVLVKPHITEKAAILTDDNVYVFRVTKDANKQMVKQAIQELYKKTPVKVRIARNAPKRVLRRTGMGTKPGVKKAYVYMKKGDTIDIL